MPQKPRATAPTLREAEVAGCTSDVDSDQQPRGKTAGGDSPPDVPRPEAPLPELSLDGSVGEE
jgi:hypothetical protein